MLNYTDIFLQIKKLVKEELDYILIKFPSSVKEGQGMFNSECIKFYMLKEKDIKTMLNLQSKIINDIFLPNEIHFNMMYHTKENTLNYYLLDLYGSEYVKDFVRENNLEKGILAVIKEVPKYFNTSDFEISIFPVDNTEMIAVDINSELDTKKFIEKIGYFYNFIYLNYPELRGKISVF